MERNIITMSESHKIIMPDNVVYIWMSEPELVELFGIIVPTLRAAIRAVYKSGALKEYEVQKYIRLENGYNADVFNFPMIVALVFRIDSFGAEQVCNAVFERLYLRKEKISIFFSLGINGRSMSNYHTRGRRTKYRVWSLLRMATISPAPRWTGVSTIPRLT